MSASQAQQITKRFNLEEFDGNVMVNSMLSKINDIRKAENLPPFTHSDILSEAAANQAESNRKYNKVSHEQPKKKMAQPADRVRYFGGLYEEVDEFDLGMTVQTKSTLKSGRRHKNPSSYDEIVDYSIAEWKESDLC